MKIAIIPIGQAGRNVATRLQDGIRFDCSTTWQKRQFTTLPRNDVAARWQDFDAFIFIGALGICVRTIAPLVRDKHTDPAVLCIDSFGENVISVLSGHVGGANALTQDIARQLRNRAVITTQSDLAGLWALDTLARRFGWCELLTTGMNHCIFDFVNRRPTALLLDIRDEGTDYLERTMPDHVTIVESVEVAIRGGFSLLMVVSPRYYATIDDFEGDLLYFVPRCLSFGFGLAHQAQPAAAILREMQQAINQAGFVYDHQTWHTIDVKRDEPFVRTLKRAGIGADLHFFTAEELSTVEVPNPSATVQQHVGTPSVCEAAAVLGSGGGQLLLQKTKGSNWTLAIAIDRAYCRPAQSPAPSHDPVPPAPSHDPEPPSPSPCAVLGGSSAEPPSPHIEIVGAGPGDPDLISVRGRKMLERADLILYAGSLVPRALTECHKPGAVVRSSADMTLEEQCALMKEHYDRGHFIVRLHTGDPCIFGAIQEQMAFFDREGMSYHITPGISSFLAAAAELRSQFTIPERTQTIILTRGEGRTPMPEREKLHLLARSQSTMCIFLSAAIVDDVQAQLLQHYPEDTPVAACYHLTWPDQKIYRGVLRDLAKIVHDNHLTLTTMLVVGEAIDNRLGLSALYDKHFSHLYRTGE